MSRRSSRLRRALRAHRQAIAACARSRRDRLAAGPEAAASWELALLGALLLRPRLIPAFAREHPPAWWVSTSGLEIMKALFCRSGRFTLHHDDLIETLASHGALDLVGGPDAIRALVAPRPELDAAVLELDALMDRLPLAEQEEILREETLADLDELFAAAKAPVAGPVTPPVEREPTRQLELFAVPVVQGGPEDDR